MISFMKQVIGTLVMLTISLNASAETNQKKHLKVAVILRATDQFNHTVRSITGGLETAKYLFEKEHPGVSIQIKRYYHGRDFESIMRVANQAMSEGYTALFGGEYSQEGFVISEMVEKKPVVFVTPTSSNPRVNEGKPNVFRGGYTDTKVGASLAHFMIEKLKPNAIGVLHNLSSMYADSLTKQFLSTYEELKNKGLKVPPLVEEQVLSDAFSFDKQVIQFLKNKVSHVVMFTHQEDFEKFNFHATNRSFFPVYLGSDGWGSNEDVLSKFVKTATHGNQFIGYRNTYWKEGNKNKLTQRFIQAYRKSQKEAPSGPAAISFDSAWMLFLAMNQAKNPNSGEQIRSEIKKLKDIPAVTIEKFTFGSNNAPERDLQVYKISQDGIQFEATLR